MLIGQKSGYLTRAVKTSRSEWLCQCDCGERVIIKSRYLSTRKACSCGCTKGGRTIEEAIRAKERVAYRENDRREVERRLLLGIPLFEVTKPVDPSELPTPEELQRMQEEFTEHLRQKKEKSDESKRQKSEKR